MTNRGTGFAGFRPTIEAQTLPGGRLDRRDQNSYGATIVALIVQKYGGSSVGDAESIKRVAKRVAEAKRAGNDVVVVVSAMGDTTDELIDLAQQVTPIPPQREMDILLTAGERDRKSVV